ncbi:MAG: NfeD family protein [candidate division Zixibacteria bacterium]|nr:NfeD family protein [candidate division Zixibacteria bacterium]
METMFWIWLAAALLFLIIEVTMPGLIFVCFSTGAIGAAIYAQFTPDDYLIQTALFGGITITLIPLTRRFAKQISLSGTPKSNVDALVGQPAIVVKDIDPVEGVGQIRVEGEIWSANADSVIATGSMVTVEKVEGNRLFVRRGLPESYSTEHQGGTEGVS